MNSASGRIAIVVEWGNEGVVEWGNATNVAHAEHLYANDHKSVRQESGGYDFTSDVSKLQSDGFKRHMGVCYDERRIANSTSVVRKCAGCISASVHAAYVTYILDRYDSLPSKVIFVSSEEKHSAFLQPLPHMAFDRMFDDDVAPLTCSKQYSEWHDCAVLRRFSLDETEGGAIAASIGLRSRFGMLHHWYNAVLPSSKQSSLDKGRLLCPVCYGNTFGIRRKALLTVCRAEWRRILMLLEDSKTFEHTAFMERTWSVLVSPTSTWVRLPPHLFRSTDPWFERSTVRGVVRRVTRPYQIRLTANLVVINSVFNARHTVRTSIRSFDSTSWDCLLFNRNSKLRLEALTRRCSVVQRNWSWVAFLRYLTPVFVRRYKYIHIILDDIHLDGYLPHQTMQYMIDYGVDVASPRVDGSMYAFMQDNETIRVNFLEMFSTLFTQRAWICMWSMIDIIVSYLGVHSSSVGWGYDVCFPVHCPAFKLSLVPQRVRHLRHKKNRMKRAIGLLEMQRINRLTRFVIGRNCVAIP